ncbi:hypothetical protein NDU88_002799 [Pleurodeles waltl]|uniref:Uncharacterized protein n=1 Tax=Pleurodeles waltl TaxID=8319 RepID=A0AAV7TLN2_PLEWA|nr:hypothetical protein NDU88_002799 [Pleurodeles waltl]
MGRAVESLGARAPRRRLRTAQGHLRGERPRPDRAGSARSPGPIPQGPRARAPREDNQAGGSQLPARGSARPPLAPRAKTASADRDWGRGRRRRSACSGRPRTAPPGTVRHQGRSGAMDVTRTTGGALLPSPRPARPLLAPGAPRPSPSAPRIKDAAGPGRSRAGLPLENRGEPP